MLLLDVDAAAAAAVDDILSTVERLLKCSP